MCPICCRLLLLAPLSIEIDLLVDGTMRCTVIIIYAIRSVHQLLGRLNMLYFLASQEGVPSRQNYLWYPTFVLFKGALVVVGALYQILCSNLFLDSTGGKDLET
jgi:hypothetical protein